MDTLTKPIEHTKIISRLKKSAKKRGLEFNLTTSDLDEIGFPLTCPILGIPLKWHTGKPQDDSYSFDRIDSALGYVKGNIQILSVKANRAKNNLTEDELKMFSVYFR